MLEIRGFRSLAETGRVLGVSEQRVLEMIEHGPLIGRDEYGEGLVVHADDLEAFRRPLGVVASVSQGQSTFCKLFCGALEGDQSVAAAQQDATVRGRRVAPRNTLESAGYLALLDERSVSAASQRFDRFVSPEPNTGCFLWTGAVDRKGYGFFRLTSSVVVYAHRYALSRASGPLGEGLDVDHLCFQKSCVNPRHLEAVTWTENARRRDARLAAAGTHNLAAAHSVRHLRLVRP